VKAGRGDQGGVGRRNRTRSAIWNAAQVVLNMNEAGCVAGNACYLKMSDNTMIPTSIRAAAGLRQPLDARLADDERKRRGESGAPGTAVITKTKPQTKRPSLYRVLLLNDDYTPMEFVVHVLERFFNKDREGATRIMLHVHHHGIGECGVFTYEVAETKVTQVMDFARKHHHPLQCVMEKK
jgi:ATP-dependent Clp protease adaptor protein ClpS